MAAAVLASGNAIEERHPISDSCLFQFVALLQDIGRYITFIDALERPVVAALHAKGNLVLADVPESHQLLYGLVF